MEKFEKLIYQAKYRPDFESACSKAGITLKKVGRGKNGATRYHSAGEKFSSVVFIENADQSWVIIDNSARIGRKSINPIDFFTEILGYSFKDAVITLSGGWQAIDDPEKMVDRPMKKVEPEVTFEQPSRSQGKANKLFAYLNKTRCIPAPVVSELLHIGAVYQSEYTKKEKAIPLVVFPCYDQSGKMVGANTVATFSDLKFKHIVSGSDPTCCWFFKNNVDRITPDVKIYFCESEIDAISLCCLTNNRGIYVSMAGVKDISYNSMMERFGGTPVICTDNDQAGNLFRERHADCETMVPSVGKDWNDQLQYMVKNNLDFPLKDATSIATHNPSCACR